MFDLDDPLAVGASMPGADGLAELIVSARDARQQAECDLFILAGLWADAHDPACGLAGADRCRCLGAEGTPQVTEFAHDELGALLHVSGQTAAGLMADAIDVRHRLPETWDRVRTGAIRPYMARFVAQTTRHLDGRAALVVDDTLTPHWGILPWRRLRTLIEATVIDVDPDAADARTRAAEAERFVRAGQTNEHGLKLLVAKAVAGDVIFFLAMVHRIADILAADGDPDPIDVRRSKAIGVLANPALALHLLVTHATPDHHAVSPGTGTDVDSSDTAESDATPQSDAAPHSGASTTETDQGGADRSETDRHGTSDSFYPEPPGRSGPGDHDPGPADAGPADPGCNEPGPDDPPPTDPEGDGYRGVALPGGGDFRAPDWLTRIDHRKLRPTVMLHVHVTDRALVGGEGCPHTARVEDVGPITLTQVRGFLDNPFQQIRVQPVLDPARTAPADSYEIPMRLREAARLRHLADTFPYGTRDARSMDLDHTIPWEAGGPTAVENLSPLTRHHHRAKTHGGWGKRQPDPDTIVWRSPHGWIYLVTPHGTLDLGHTSYAHAIWNAARPTRADRGDTHQPTPHRNRVELAS